MKTIKEWLETLEEPYRSEALENLNSDERASSLSDALLEAFVWSDTTQGGDYWDELHEKLEQNEN